MKYDVTIWDAIRVAKYRQSVKEIEEIFNSTNDFDQIIKEILSIISKALKSEIGTFWLYNKDGDGLIKVKSSYGYTDSNKAKLLPGEQIVGKVISSGLSMISNNSNIDSRFEYKVEFRIQSVLCVPLNYKGLSIACIELINKIDDSYYDESDEEFCGKLFKVVEEKLIYNDLMLNFLILNRQEEESSKFINIGKNINAVSMFIDLRNFTEIISESGNDNAFYVLNAFLGYVTDVVIDNNGYIDKYMGDKIMATWGVVDSDNDMIEHALKAALNIFRNKNELVEKTKEDFKTIVDFSIGISYGKVYAGILGNGKKSSFSIIGDSVNIANKLCKSALENEILVSSEIIDNIKDKNYRFTQRKIDTLYKNNNMDAYTLNG